MDARQKVIIALDDPLYDQAVRIVSLLGDDVSFYKVGAGLYASAGEKILSFLKDAGKKIFLDMKFHDIPSAVAAAGRAMVVRGVDMFTVHTGGGVEMMSACRRAVSEAASAAGSEPPKILGVTILTSISERILREELLSDIPIPRLVVHLAETAKKAGVDGVVASPLELSLLRKYHPENFIIVTPGIRPAGTDKHEQKRTLTPAEAIHRGASYIVVGRAVTDAPEPAEALQRIYEEIEII
ncbi:MAG: orotidine-5'-phosphate decarboxylase [bacterium]